MIDFFIKVKQQESQNLPFVIYRKPNKTKLIGLFQKNDHLYFAEDFKETGFVFAPFNGSQIILIPKKESILWESELTAFKADYDSENKYPVNNQDKERFESLVQKGVDATTRGVFKKVVLSRKEIIDLPNFDLVSVFKKLIYTYPDAFCYCWYHPKIGLWIGATPERLLKASRKKFFTMALAGTQNYEDTIDVVWEKKEMEEQQFVTDFILDNIKLLTREVAVSSPYTLKAGGILHIKTDIEGKLNKDSNMKQVVSVLHPTPAVCGLPKESARNFILENEKYDREYYTGFLGEINKKEFSKDTSKTDLYVNLRCMQITNKEAHLYVGCGITKDSIPENEWKESVNKSMTMKRVL
ncbi:chorismate-binding protein [Flavobacterium frigoris]|uniref:isochorismate synthase n=1 Tax=Flavobacterium frigoris (strain PS1) TaxID=1086011 RepID=H7FU55_FLAFP|nr:chorismate-binding protein [Flavobacterium frigoris]EIA07907.1 isochorismate synthase [Flavobacterium frigoris PS1]